MLDRAASFGRFYDSSALDGVVSIGENSVTPAPVPLAFDFGRPPAAPRAWTGRSFVRALLRALRSRVCAGVRGILSVIEIFRQSTEWYSSDRPRCNIVPTGWGRV
jgi:hypothetical protein